MDAPTATSAIAVLDFGKVVLTEDTGRTWKVIPLPAPYDDGLSLAAVKFIDPRHGWIVGVTAGSTNYGIILATNDAGRTWKLESQMDNPLADVSVSRSKVFVTGRGAIYWRNRP